MFNHYDNFIVTLDFYENIGITPNLTRDLLINSLDDSFKYHGKIIRNILADPSETKYYNKEGYMLHLKVDNTTKRIYYIEMFIPNVFAVGIEDVLNKIEGNHKINYSPFFQVWENMYREVQYNPIIDSYTKRGQILTDIINFGEKFSEPYNLKIKSHLIKVPGQDKRDRALIFEL